jgi:hypothetical protein
MNLGGRFWPTEGGAEDYPDKLNDLISWHHADVKYYFDIISICFLLFLLSC